MGAQYKELREARELSIMKKQRLGAECNEYTEAGIWKNRKWGGPRTKKTNLKMKKHYV